MTRISHSDALDLGYTRALLESYAVTVGFERITETVLEEMDAMIEEMGECRLPNELPRLLRIDLAFHRRLVESAEMPRLLELWASLDGQIGALYIRAIEAFHPGIDFIVEFHQKYITAIRSGDPGIARQTVLEHYVRLNDPTISRSTSIETSIATATAEMAVSND